MTHAKADPGHFSKIIFLFAGKHSCFVLEEVGETAAPMTRSQVKHTPISVSKRKIMPQKAFVLNLANSLFTTWKVQFEVKYTTGNDKCVYKMIRGRFVPLVEWTAPDDSGQLLFCTTLYMGGGL